MDNKKCENCGKINSNISKFCSQCGYELLKERIIESFEDKSFKKKNKTLPILAGIIFFFISFFGVQKFLSNNSNTFDKVLMKTASEINASCPIMVDSDTRLDNSVAMPNKEFHYNYTLINYEKSDLNIEDLRAYVEPNVVNNVKTNPDMKSFKDNEVTLVYNYKDKNGVFLMKINVTPDKYK